MREVLLSINKRGLQADFSWLRNLQKIIKKKFRIKQSISLALVDQTEIKRLNRVYRHQNKITDVLSFNIDGDEILGEVIICLDRARQQAKTNKHSLKDELKFLTVHGILHLLGYDHEKSMKHASAQKKAEEDILKLLHN